MKIVTKTIGSAAGRDYPATAAGVQQAWNDIPDSLKDTDISLYQILFGKESEVVMSNKIFMGSKQADSAHRIRIAAVPGESYREHANVLINPLVYNPAVGAAVRCTLNYAVTFDIYSQDWLTIEDLQLCNSGGGSSGAVVKVTQDGMNVVLQNNIVRNTASGYYVCGVELGAGALLNTHIELKGITATGVRFTGRNDVKVENVGVVRAAAGTSYAGFDNLVDPINIRNCYSFGFDNFVSNAAKFSGSNNASDKAILFGTNRKENIAAADQFVDPTGDYRLKDGSVLIDTGAVPSQGNATTMNGPRQQGIAADIGPWEYPSVIQSPTATITSIVVDANKNVTVSGTTTGSPKSGSFSLTPTTVTGNKAEAQGPKIVPLSGNAFSLTFATTKVGRYSASVTVSNDSFSAVAANTVGDFNVDGALATSVIQDPIDGQVLKVHGTTSGNPTSASFIVPAAASNPNGAVSQTSSVVLGAGTFTLSISLPEGNYDAGILTFTTADGTSLPQPGTRPVVILGISGNPTVPDDDPDAAKTASINLVSSSGIPIDAGPALKFAWFDQATPDLFDAPTDTGTAVVGAGGTLKVALANSIKASGQVGWLVVTNSDGDPEAVHKAFSGPVKVD